MSFVHIASIEDGDNNPLTSLPAFATFSAGIKDRSEIPPATTKLTEMGRYTSQPVGEA
ncbi:MAG: hypothetical protein ACREPM_08895 [Gemmatimonadaceae bacterium]